MERRRGQDTRDVRKKNETKETAEKKWLMEGLLSDSLDSRCEEMAKEYVDEAERERER
jgi:hypothetical protein